MTPQEEWKMRVVLHREGLPQPELAPPKPEQIGTPVPAWVKAFGWWALIAAICAIVVWAGSVLYHEDTKFDYSNGFKGEKPLSQHNRHHVGPR